MVAPRIYDDLSVFVVMIGWYQVKVGKSQVYRFLLIRITQNIIDIGLEAHHTHANIRLTLPGSSWRYATKLENFGAHSSVCGLRYRWILTSWALVRRVPDPLQWNHNERDGVSNHQSCDGLLSRLFGHRSKKTSKLRVTGLCEGNSPVTRKRFPFDDVIMWPTTSCHISTCGSPQKRL